MVSVFSDSVYLYTAVRIALMGLLLPTNKTARNLVILIGLLLGIAFSSVIADTLLKENEYVPPNIGDVNLSSDTIDVEMPVINVRARYNQALNEFDCENSDCMYAAIDKDRPLPQDYRPPVLISLNKANGTLIPDAAKQADLMITAFSNEYGVRTEVRSSYRSYSLQKSVFENWVSIYQKRGLNYGAAVREANTLSALPGHSEHQLGTTLDLNTVGADPFDKDQNSDLFRLIEEHAHNYGFVISYPRGQENITGYAHEPWHIRYVGTELASELYSLDYTSGDGPDISTYLRKKSYSE